MKRNIFILILIFLNLQSCFSDSGRTISLVLDFTPWTLINFYSDKIDIEYYSSGKQVPEKTNSINSSLKIENDLYFYSFTYPGDIFEDSGQLINNFSPSRQKWLVLFCKDLNYATIHRSNKDTPLYNFSSEYGTVSKSKLTYTATSYLIEKDATYPVDNLMIENTGFPWVEGVDGYGIGERININYEKYYNSFFTSLVLSNGFVSYDNPSLYSKNSRIKKLRIWYNNESEFQDFEIEDTPNYQILKLLNPVKKISIEILEVYKGDLWEDTCISVLLPAESQM